MKIVTIVGARPQFIKAATVSRAIKNYNKENSGQNIKEVIIHTGQHFDKNMSQIFFDEMKNPEFDYNLGINSLTHGAMTGRMLEETETILCKEKPDWVLVYGDTNSTLAGALAASKLNIRIAHVEAGLRSFNMQMPEEVNRVLTDRLSDILFCPTDTALENLKKEGFPNKLSTNRMQLIKNIGDVMYDSALFYSEYCKKPFLDRNILNSPFVLATIHRQENVDDIGKMKVIFQAFEEISKDTTVILPVHPRTKNIIKKLNIDINNLQIIEPVGYLEMIWLLKNCQIVMTDSGGLQKEAFFFKKPCIILREETEWQELVMSGVHFLVGAQKEKINSVYKTIYNKQFNFSNSFYGDGKASEKIIQQIKEI